VLVWKWKKIEIKVLDKFSSRSTWQKVLNSQHSPLSVSTRVENKDGWPPKPVGPRVRQRYMLVLGVLSSHKWPNKWKKNKRFKIYEDRTKIWTTHLIMYRVSLRFIAVKTIHETPIRNVESEGCDHINEKCHKTSKPKPHV